MSLLSSVNHQITATLTPPSEGASSTALELTVQYPPWLTFNCFGVDIPGNPLLSGENKTTTFYMDSQESLAQPVGHQIFLVHPRTLQTVFPFDEGELNTRTVLDIAQTGLSISFNSHTEDLQMSIGGRTWTVETANPQRLLPPDLFPAAAASKSCFEPFGSTSTAASSSARGGIPRLSIEGELAQSISSRAPRTSGPNFGRLSVLEQIERATEFSLEQDCDEGAAAASAAPYPHQYLTEQEQMARAIALSLGEDPSAAPAAAAAASAAPPRSPVYRPYLDQPQQSADSDIAIEELTEDQQFELAIAESQGGQEARVAYLKLLKEQKEQRKANEEEFFREFGDANR